ncbi:MAG TPA: outer membrane beta-barrel protein [Steroidobacteraceae bacterium]|nr:outer membrane beta-barrel protein [Steroidobacteraceae bacterium]
MKRLSRTPARFAALAALLTVSIGAQAYETNFEIVPIVGYRFGGQLHDSSVDESRDIDPNLSYGLALNFAKTWETQWELTYSRQSTTIESLAGAAAPGAVDIVVEYLQFGGTYFYSEEDHEGAVPYVVGGLGLTHFKPSGPGLDDRYEPSINLGIGLRVPLAKKVALRLEGRGYLTLMDTTGSIFCRSDASGAACTIHARASGLWQIEALFGIAFAL